MILTSAINKKSFIFSQLQSKSQSMIEANLHSEEMAQIIPKVFPNIKTKLNIDCT